MDSVVLTGTISTTTQSGIFSVYLPFDAKYMLAWDFAFVLISLFFLLSNRFSLVSLTFFLGASLSWVVSSIMSYAPLMLILLTMSYLIFSLGQIFFKQFRMR